MTAPRPPDFNQLPVFLKIYEQGSLTLAAQQLGLKQSTLSHALKKLRLQLHDPLFQRRGNRLVPTPRARQLYARAKPLLASLEQSLTPLHSQLPSPLLVQVDVWIQAVLLAELVRVADKDKRWQPQIECRPAANAADSSWPEQLLAGSLHLAVAAAEGGSGICSELLYCEDYVAAVRAGHPATHAASLTLRDYLMLSHLLIAPASTAPIYTSVNAAANSGTADPVASALANAAGQKNISRVWVAHPGIAAALVETTDLVFTCPRHYAEAHGWICIKPPLRLPIRRVSLHWREGGQPPDALATLAQELVLKLRVGSPSPSSL